MKKSNSLRKRTLSRAQIIAFGFAVVILSGTFMLMLPIASKDGAWTSFIDALFTSTSATCVTGLIIADTFTKWTLFGQLILLILIQIGGLGVITITGLLYIMTRRKFSINMRGLIQDTVFSEGLGDTSQQIKSILRRAFLIEGVGAVVLMTQFIPEFGFARGFYYGIFHAISTFCNAGFDLMGIIGQYSSMTSMVYNPVVIYTLIALIILGGLGFIVWDDIIRHGLHYKKYSLHTRIVIVANIILIAVGTFLFILFENDGVFSGMDPATMFNNALFASITPRTAGINIVDLGSMSQESKLLTSVFMFVGGNPGSTAGGVKVTTVVVMGAYVICHLIGTNGVHIMKRRIDEDNINNAALVFGLNVMLIATSMIVISAIQPVALDSLMLEVFSAMGTVGLSTGLTRELLQPSLIVLIMLMFIGRIGTVTFALSFTNKKNKMILSYPVENVNVG